MYMHLMGCIVSAVVVKLLFLYPIHQRYVARCFKKKKRTMLPLAGHWHPVWSKTQYCRIKLICYLNTIDKVPIFPHCLSGLGARCVHPIRAAEKGRKRSFVQKNPIFSEFSP